MKLFRYSFPWRKQRRAWLNTPTCLLFPSRKRCRSCNASYPCKDGLIRSSDYSRMTMYRRILVPVDGSTASNAGRAHAIGLARVLCVSACTAPIANRSYRAAVRWISRSQRLTLFPCADHHASPDEAFFQETSGETQEIQITPLPAETLDHAVERFGRTKVQQRAEPTDGADIA